MAFIKSKNFFYMASGGAVTMIALGIYSIDRTNKYYQDTDFFRETMREVQSNFGAVKFLGAPITGKNVSYVKADGSVAKFTAAVKGSQSYGTLHFWVEKKSVGEDVLLNVNRIELELPNERSRRLLIKYQPNEGIIENKCH